MNQPLVTELLRRYSGPEAVRVTQDILILSKGSVAQVRLFTERAQTDYRDVLYWAEYYDTDPMLRGRDARGLVDYVLAQWGARKAR